MVLKTFVEPERQKERTKAPMCCFTYSCVDTRSWEFSPVTHMGGRNPAISSQHLHYWEGGIVYCSWESNSGCLGYRCPNWYPNH